MRFVKWFKYKCIRTIHFIYSITLYILVVIAFFKAYTQFDFGQLEPLIIKSISYFTLNLEEDGIGSFLAIAFAMIVGYVAIIVGQLEKETGGIKYYHKLRYYYWKIEFFPALACSFLLIFLIIFQELSNRPSLKLATYKFLALLCLINVFEMWFIIMHYFQKRFNYNVFTKYLFIVIKNERSKSKITLVNCQSFCLMKFFFNKVSLHACDNILDDSKNFDYYTCNYLSDILSYIFSNNYNDSLMASKAFNIMYEMMNFIIQRTQRSHSNYLLFYNKFLVTVLSWIEKCKYCDYSNFYAKYINIYAGLICGCLCNCNDSNLFNYTSYLYGFSDLLSQERIVLGESNLKYAENPSLILAYDKFILVRILAVSFNSEYHILLLSHVLTKYYKTSLVSNLNKSILTFKQLERFCALSKVAENINEFCNLGDKNLKDLIPIIERLMEVNTDDRCSNTKYL